MASLFTVLPTDGSLSGAGATTGQFRAFWADAFGEGINDQSEIDSLVASTKAAHANAIVAQVVRRGDCFCLRSGLPVNESIASGFDPLQALIDAAHGQGIEVHAWVIANAMWNSTTPPKDPNHIFNLHGPAASGRDNWVMTRSDGVSKLTDDWMLDPGHPDAAAWVVNAATSIVRNYKVDGINLDRIRYPDGNLGSLVPSWGYNPTALARFRAETGHTDTSSTNPEWTQWRRDQVTGIVRRIYLESTALKPSIRVSADVITYGYGPQRGHQGALAAVAVRHGLSAGIHGRTGGACDELEDAADLWAPERHGRRDRWHPARRHSRASRRTEHRDRDAHDDHGRHGVVRVRRSPDRDVSRDHRIAARDRRSARTGDDPRRTRELAGRGRAWPDPDPDRDTVADNLPAHRWSGHRGSRESRLGRRRLPRLLVRTERLFDALPGRDRDRGRRLLQQRHARLARGHHGAGRVPRNVESGARPGSRFDPRRRRRRWVAEYGLAALQPRRGPAGRLDRTESGRVVPVHDRRTVGAGHLSPRHPTARRGCAVAGRLRRSP